MQHLGIYESHTTKDDHSMASFGQRFPKETDAIASESTASKTTCGTFRILHVLIGEHLNSRHPQSVQP
jgi:hypothetical protein